MNDIDRIFDDLRCTNSEDVQARGIEAGKTVKHFSVFIMPVMNKQIWYNCAKILEDKNDKELKPYFPVLLQWLQDMNWPGAEIIFNRLLKVTDPELLIDYNLCLSNAKHSGDKPWEEALDDFWREYCKKHNK